MENRNNYYNTSDQKRRRVDSKHNNRASQKSKEEEDRIAMEKVIEDIKVTRKSIDDHKKKIKELNSEILEMQNKMLNMFPSTQIITNPSKQFPSFQELSYNINTFCKGSCPKFFVEFLKPEFDFPGIIFFYKNVFTDVQNHIEEHFAGLAPTLKRILQNAPNMEPLNCVLDKSYQANWSHILSKLTKEDFCAQVTNKIQSNLDITGNGKVNVNNVISKFVKETLILFLQCYLITPRIYFDIKHIGETAINDYKKYESFEGDIYPNQEGFILLPMFYSEKIKESYNSKNTQINIISLPKIISKDYAFEN